MIPMMNLKIIQVLGQRNIGKSLANLLQNRILKSKPPIKDRTLDNATKLIKEKMIDNKKTQKMYFDSKGTVEVTNYKKGEKYGYRINLIRLGVKQE